MDVDPTPRCSRCDTCKKPDEFPPSKATNKSQWCRKCLREDARRRKGLKATDRLVACRQCSTPFGTAYAKAMYCSRVCKNRARNAAQRSDLMASKPTRRCVWCGIDMPQSMRADAKFCSATCNSTAHSAMRNWRRRASGRAPLRPRINPLPSFIDIAERDRWRCGICGKSVNKRLNFPDPLAGSLDHLLPVSCGGTHEPANLQLAHFRCNWSKRADAVNDQLRLIG